MPSLLVKVDEMPLTSSGKVDRSELVLPQQIDLPAHPGGAPEGEVEQGLAQIWCQVLEVDQVGRNDNFFTLGGNINGKKIDELKLLGLKKIVRQLLRE